MKIKGNQVRPGNLLLLEGGLWRVTKSQATKTGKSGAYNQVEIKNISTGTKNNVRFRASEDVERAILEEKKYSYIYSDGDNVIVMDPETFEQVFIPEDIVGDSAAFLEDGMEVTVEIYEGVPQSFAVPSQVTLAVSETEPVIKGQTASASFKPALLTNGIRISVPQFVNVGDRIVVDTYEHTYVRREDS